MIAFRVSVNGRTICTAGTQAGVLTAVVTALKNVLTTQLGLHVGARHEATGEHVQWDVPQIRRGDVIEIEVVEVDTVDPPLTSRASGGPYWNVIRHHAAQRLRAGLELARNDPRELAWSIARASVAAVTGPFLSPFGFRVAVRNEPLCAAGIRGSGALATTVTWVGSDGDGERPDVDVNSTGLDPVAGEYLDWPTAALRIGDTVRIEIVDAASADPPIRRHAVSSACSR